MTKQLPLIVVLGATACGKSRLAIELARRFNGQILSADSMQVYKGLDIVTNKVSEHEQLQAKHHMINFLDPTVRFSVVDFRDKSLDIIKDLSERNILPIVVGGTNYYIESILWKSFLLGPTFDPSKQNNTTVNNTTVKNTKNIKSEHNTLIDSETILLGNLSEGSLHTIDDFDSVEKFFAKPIYNDGFKDINSLKLWRILEQVDPESAYKFHMNDRRRIIRCLQIIQEKRRNYSDLLRDRNRSCEEGRVSLGGPLRFDNTCVIWLDCDCVSLDKILDERVDQMLNKGLLAELENFHDEYNKRRHQLGKKADYEKGIFQTIGFKEFHDYLVMDPEIIGTEEGNRILNTCIKQMKISTRRYARTQLKWIRRRFLKSDSRDLPSIFKLTTSLKDEDWSEQVRKPAFQIVESLLENCTFSDDLLKFKEEPREQTGQNNPGKLHCESCDKILIGSNQIEHHLNSKSHKRNQSKSKKQECDS